MDNLLEESSDIQLAVIYSKTGKEFAFFETKLLFVFKPIHRSSRKLSKIMSWFAYQTQKLAPKRSRTVKAE